MGSSRLPGKVLANVAGRPALRVLLDRLAAARSLDDVAVAIPDGRGDDALADAIEGWGTTVVRGPGEDVLARYAKAAAEMKADVVVRVTGDCPLIDPRVVDAVVEELLRDPPVEYASLDESFPDGADCEAFTVTALAIADANATLPSEREHVTPWIRARPDEVPARMLVGQTDFHDVRLTIDEPADLDVVRNLADQLGVGADVTIDAYARLLRQQPELNSRRVGVTRNEGLWRSQNRDDVDKIGLRHGRARSDELLARAIRVIPSATQTLSKGANQFVRGVTPAFLESGSGCHVTDVDGNMFIDYPMALGPIILGYGHPRTVAAVSEQLQRGSTFTLPHPLEVEVAELVVDAVPCAEMVRFAKNGSDATDAAIRLARAVTGRNVVLTCGYHGWHDWYVVSTPRDAGVPVELKQYIEGFAFNDLAGVEEALARHDGEVAAVILEIGFDDPHPGYLEALRDAVHRAGAVLIYDEIVTGFRFALGGAQEYYGVAPDLVALGKAMANGLPLAAIAGRRELMEDFDRIFFSGTFGGETLSLAAARVTISEIRDAPVIEHIWREGGRLHEGMRAAIATSGLDIELMGQAPRGALVFRQEGRESPALRGLFLQETVRRGVLFGGPIFTTYAHDSRDIDRTIEICGEALDVLRSAVERSAVEQSLEGPAPDVVFRLVRN